MGRIARFVKPLLGMVPPDIGGVDPRGILALAGVAARVRGAAGTGAVRLRAAHDDELARLPRPVVRDGPLKATMAASGIIGTFQGIRSPGTAYVLLHHYMGEIDGAFRAWGMPRGGTGSVSEAIASAAREAGAEIRTEAPVERILTRDGRATGVVLDGGEEIAARHVLSSVDARADVGRPARGRRARRRDRGRPAPGPLPRLVRQGQPRGRRAAVVHVAARRRRASPRCDLDLAIDGVHGARLRRGEVRPLQRPPVHRPDHSDPARPLDGAARQARDQLLRAVRAVRAGARAGRLGRAARSVRRRGRRRHRGVRAGPALDDRRAARC